MILVTGASGQLGTQVLKQLEKSNTPAVGGTRAPANLERFRKLDFDSPETLNFGGIGTLVLISAGTAEDDVVINRHENAIAAAKRDGVRHIVYTSLAGEGDHLSFALAHRWTERRLQSSSVAWTILRNGLYAELIGYLLAPQNGVISAPFGSGGVAAVARQDLAEAAATIARDPDAHSGKTYNLVGNQTVTGQAVADRLGVNYHPGTLGDLRDSLNAAELLPFQPAMLTSIHSAAAHGFLAGTSTDLTKLLGREPLDPLTLAAAAAQN